MSKTRIPIASITVDEATHPRGKLNEETAEDYGRALKDGEKLPLTTVPDPADLAPARKLTSVRASGTHASPTSGLACSTPDTPRHGPGR